MSQHVYIHVPFCTGKCGYCAFYSRPYAPQSAEAYLDALKVEFAGAPAALGPTTLYVGGGTPGILSIAQWQRLAGIIDEYCDKTHLAEWTVESNPDAINRPLLRLWRDAGVTRVSMGAQTVDDALLATLGRRHTSNAMHLAMAALKDEGFANVNLDLLAGIPGAPRDAFSRSLEAMLALAPAHLSVYAFTVEPHTRWEAGVRAGALPAPDDRDQLRDLRLAVSALKRHGLRRYEISNYARPGRECLHNLSCWAGNDYLGFGPAAATRFGKQRWTNAPDLDAYVRAAHLGQPFPREAETLDPQQDVGERLAFAFRMTKGFNLNAFVARWGAPSALALPGWLNKLQALAAEGLVRQHKELWSPTSCGLDFNDRIAEQLLS